jgi:hypothetical protein
MTTLLLSTFKSIPIAVLAFGLAFGAVLTPAQSGAMYAAALIFLMVRDAGGR